MTPHVEIDAMDALLVAELQQDARVSLTDLGRRAHLSTSATRARLHQLERRGIITGYTAAISPSTAGYTLHAVVRMKVHGSLFDQVSTVLDREPQIVRCLRVTGESCYNMEVLARDMADLERITSQLARVGSITTDLVYEVVTQRETPLQQTERLT